MSATSNAARRHVRVESDTKTLLQALRVTFTRPQSVLGELLQNGRRAGATLIDITVTDENIAVRDNGCGIVDPAILLNIAVSGWDEDTKAADACYGLGFIGTLFCCELLEVSSRGQHMLAKTGDLIDCKPVGLSQCNEDGFTTITLHGHTLGKADVVQNLLARLTRGFPIEVHVNGKAQARDHALDLATWVESPMGWTRPQDVLSRSARTNFYLQGLPIGVYASVDDWRSQNGDQVIHLRSPQVKGRLPERDCVLNPEEVADLVRSSRLALGRAKLEEFAAAGQVDALCKHADMIQATNSFDLLESLQVVPGAWLVEITDTPRHGLFESHSDWQGSPEGAVGFDVVAARGIWETDEDDCDLYPLRACHYIRARQGFQVYGNSAVLDWFANRFGVKVVKENDVVLAAVDIIATLEEAFFEADDVIACKRITLDHPEYGPVVDGVLPECAMTADNRLLVTPQDNDWTEVAVKQIADFVWDESEDEEALWRARKDLRVVLAQLFNGKDLAAVLRRVLEQGSSAMDRLLKNSRFAVSFDADGRLTVEEITS